MHGGNGWLLTTLAGDRVLISQHRLEIRAHFTVTYAAAILRSETWRKREDESRHAPSAGRML